MKKDLLHTFITNKTKAYMAVEPSRKGTSRGETIGFMLPKYTAAVLCALSSQKIKDIAKEMNREGIKVTAALIYVWRTEEPFQKLVEEIRREFASHYWRTGADFLKQSYNYYDSGEDFSKRPSLEEYMGNCWDYNFEAKAAILSSAPVDMEPLHKGCLIALLANKSSKDVREQELTRMAVEFENQLRIKAHDNCIALMKQPVLSEYDKKVVLYYLETLKP